MAPADIALAADADDVSEVDEMVARARAAQEDWAARADQSMLDQSALAAAWALMEPSRNQELAELAVATTGLGNVRDKITKNHRKTLGLLRDIKDARTCGIISDDAETGITKIARPKGVVCAVVPSTNPVATPVNNIVNALKCGNAIVLSPSPKGEAVAEKLLGYVYAEFNKIGVPHDLVQMVPRPSSKAKTHRLMQLADTLVVTGSQANVRAAYTSGTPAIGVGAGNVTVIVDETANLADAAAKITASKTFDNATSCSSENSLIVLDEIYDDFIAELGKAGGHLLDAAGRDTLISTLWHNGHLNRATLAKDADVLLAEAGFAESCPAGTKYVLAEETEIGPGAPMSGEKMSLAVAVYRAKDYADAKEIAHRMLRHQGAGHSLGIHTSDDSRPVELGHEMPTCRVIVNQAHCFATGGSFDNGMPFSLSMGCGSWGGNSIDDNLNWTHFLNITKVVRAIPPREPSLGEIFGSYWQQSGQTGT